MIIISRLGIFNLDNIERISTDPAGVHAHTGGYLRLISTSPGTFDKIIEAIKNNKPYVEVD